MWEPVLMGRLQLTMPGIGSAEGSSIESKASVSADASPASDREYKSPYESSWAVPATSHSRMYAVAGCRAAR